MNPGKRYAALILLVTVLPNMLIGVVGFGVMWRIGSEMGARNVETLVAAEEALMAQQAREKAAEVSRFFSEYRERLEILQGEVASAIVDYPALKADHLSHLYPPSEDAMLPGYGYVHPEYGAYANWDRRGGPGSPWIRREVVEAITSDETLRNEVRARLDQAMAAVPLMERLYAQRQETCDLLWVVTLAGGAVTYPNDYAARMAENPGINTLDESQEDYVRLFGPANNPGREIRWMAPYRDAIKKTWMVSCVAPLYDGDRFVGTTGVDITLGALTQTLEQTRAGETGYVFLLTGAGHPLALPSQGVADLCGYTPQTEIIRAVLAGHENAGRNVAVPTLQSAAPPGIHDILIQALRSGRGPFRFDAGDEPKVLFTARVPETGWTVGLVRSHADMADAVVHVDQAVRGLLSGATAAFLLAILVLALGAAAAGLYIGRLNTRPFLELIGEIDAIGRGGVWRPLTGGTRPEFAGLADSVNRMVAAIHEKERRFQAIYHNVSDAVFVLDAETGAICTVNHRADELLGYGEVDILTMDIGQLSEGAPPYSQDDALAWIARARDGEELILPWCLRSSDGSLRWVELSIRRAAFNGRTQLVVSARDTAERQAAQQRLAREKQFSDAVLDVLPGIFYVFGPDRRLRRWNKRFEEAMGYSTQDIRERYLLDWFPEADRTAVGEAFERVLREGNAQVEAHLITKTGEPAPFLFTASLVSWGDEQLVIGVGLDISDRLAAESESRRLALIVEQATESVVITDLDGTITYVNPAFEKVSGYARQEVLGKNPRVLKSGKMDPAVYADLWATVRAGKAWRGRLINRCKDGSFVTEEAVIEPLRSPTGEVEHYVSVRRDITRELALEEQFLQAQKMEAVGQLAGGVAHDFNNLLQVIRGYGEMALDDTEEGTDIHDGLTQVMEAADRATTLVRQLLAFSRKQVLKLEDIDLAEVVSDLAKMIQRVIGEDIAFNIRSGPGLKCVRADKGQVEQILMNLCVNARDAMPKGGILSVETRNVVVDQDFLADNSWARPGSYVVLTVSDTGIGMDAETQRRIFESFFTTKGQAHGTGLGLATVFGIVRQHGGMVNVYSEVGEGTVFRIYLPMASGAREEAARQDEEAVPGGTETILLADDDEGVRGVAERMLAKAGYNVMCAGDGEEAVALFDAHVDGIELALLDMVMPKLGGREVFDHIRERRPDLSVLFASGYSAEGIHRGFVLEDGLEFIPKPYERNELLRKVRELLDRASAE